MVTGLGEWARRQRMPLLCVGYSVLMDLLDLASTELCKHAGNGLLEERNAFMRDQFHGFLMGHALAVKGMAFVMLLAFAALVYGLAKPFSLRAAQFLFSVLFLASGVNLSSVVLRNFWLGLGWYQP